VVENVLLRGRSGVKLRSQELHDLYALRDIIWDITLRRSRGTDFELKYAWERREIHTKLCSENGRKTPLEKI
jgi:hypothetical protein